MVLLILNLVITAPLVFMSMTANDAGNRGTNAVTKFVRDASNSGMQTRVGAACLGTTVLFLLVGSIFGAWYACIPSLLGLILTFVFKSRSTKSKERVTNARVVTKGAGEIAGNSSQAIGAAAGAVATAHGGPGAGKVARMIGEAGAKTFGAATASMDVPEYKADMSGVNDKALAEAAERYKNTEPNSVNIKAAAKSLGLKTDGLSDDEIADKVVGFLPPASMAELPDSLTNAQKVSIIYSDVREV